MLNSHALRIASARHRPMAFLELASAIVPGRIRVTAAHDPLRKVPVGDFTLASYSYRGSRVCHVQFGNCQLRSSGVA